MDTEKFFKSNCYRWLYKKQTSFGLTFFEKKEKKSFEWHRIYENVCCLQLGIVVYILRTVLGKESFLKKR